MAMETKVTVVTEADTSGIEEIETALANLQNEANISVNVDGDSSTVEDMSSKTEELSKSTDKASKSTSNLSLAISGLSGLGVSAALTSGINSADEYNLQIKALEERFGSFGVSSQQLVNSIHDVTNATAISGSQARSFFLTMSNYGVTNTNALANSMKTLYGQAALGGVAFEDASSAMEKMVASGNLSARMVTRLGASLPVLASNLGMTEDEFKTAFSDATPQQRLEMLTKAMGDTSAGVQMMNESVGSNMAEVEQQFNLALREVGTSLLPMVTAGLRFILPMVQALAGAMGNPVFAGVVGILAGGLAILLGLGGALKIAALSVEGLSAGIGVLNTLVALLTGETTLATLAEEGSTIAMAANTVAKWASTGATLALAAAEFLLASPILLVTLAIVALIAILWYLYNTNDTVRNGINSLIAIFKILVNIIIGAVLTAFNNIMNVFNRVKSVINILCSALSPLTNAWNTLKGAVSGALGPLQSVWSTLSGIANTIKSVGLNALMSAIGGAAGGADLMTAQEKAYVNSLYGSTNYEFQATDRGNESVRDIIVNVGTVDNEDRIREIVEAVRKELAWSNVTAGRTA